MAKFIEVSGAGGDFSINLDKVAGAQALLYEAVQDNRAAVHLEGGSVIALEGQVAADFIKAFRHHAEPAPVTSSPA